MEKKKLTDAIDHVLGRDPAEAANPNTASDSLALAPGVADLEQSSTNHLPADDAGALDVPVKVMRLLRRMKLEHERLFASAHKLRDRAKILGRLGLRLKAICPLGTFEQVVEEFFGDELSLRSLQRFMQIARRENHSALAAAGQVEATILSPQDLDAALRRISFSGDDTPPSVPAARKERLTPPQLVPHIIESLGGAIDLDPAAEPEKKNIPAELHYSKCENGLVQPWRAATAYIYPPCGRSIDSWVSRVVAEYGTSLSQAILMLPVKTNTAAFTELVGQAKALCFMAVEPGPDDDAFVAQSSTSPSTPLVAVYFGDRRGRERFIAAFAQHGALLIPTNYKAGSIAVLLDPEIE